MTREELLMFMDQIEDPAKDYGKILSTLQYTHFHLMEKFKKILSVYELTPAQSNVLSIIAFYYPKAASLEKVKGMVLEPNSDVSRIVVRLVEKGFVIKVVNEENRRKVSIKITEKGLNTLKKVDSESKFKKFTIDISLEEAKIFMDTLKKLRKH